MKLHELDAIELRALLERGETSSVAIVEALHARADAVEPHIHAFTRELREEAIATARERDQERARGELRGPLHGLPVSVKDNVDTAGVASTLGLRSRTSRPAERDAVTVRLAREAGAVVLGKSNVPQAMMSGMECENHVFGRTLNPWSLEHGPGGSSGGEGALVASGASVLGIGTDLGGSLRFPAAFCGVAALKPTSHRWSNVGSNTAIAGQEVAQSQIGPLARSVRDLELMMTALPSSAHARFDPDVPPLALGEAAAVDLSGLRFGWYEDDGFITPAASVRRAVRETVAALEAAGATAVPLAPTDQEEVVGLWVAALTSDGGATLRRMFDGEEVVPPSKVTFKVGGLSGWARRAAAAVLEARGEQRLAGLLSQGGAKGVDRLWEITARRKALKVGELERWSAAGIDALICPAAATPAVPVGMSKDFGLVFGYTGRYNLFGFPAGVVPVTRARADETTRADADDRLSRRAAAIEARSAGLPVAVQVVASPWREDVALAVMAAVESAARARDDFPRTPYCAATDG